MILQSKADKDDDREQKLCSLYDNALKIYSNVVTEELLSKDLKESKEVMENCITHAKELEMTILDKEYKYPTLVLILGLMQMNYVGGYTFLVKNLNFNITELTISRIIVLIQD